ncbi:hypothetical protein [Stenomitos frigidus]|uniref:Uncharacterized protein n=1 Tax=Stenomitos frigidus ULC18 TaxID=2107698 RepID=A0A2T1EB11_9CYAN|nr:hypothetical protein [Stenomitos frigidus]PSB29891.1 hypothetical protein C7B82_10080 [Stenomitos frigidus ULC18]
MKPTKSNKATKPKGYGGAASARRGRLPGYAPAYTPEQTARYKSQALRYSKAVELSAAGPDHVVWNGQILTGDDAANLRDAGGRAFKPSDRVQFFYESGRSKLDHWAVTAGGGGLEDVEAFADEITKTGQPPTCPEPTVVWSWDNPAFDWSAEGIHACIPAPPADGALTYTLPPGFAGNYNPVPSGQTRVLTITGTQVTTTDVFVPPPGGSGIPGHFVGSPYVVSFTRSFTAADTLTTPYTPGSGSTGSTVSTSGIVTLFLNGSVVSGFPANGFFTVRGLYDSSYFDESYVWNVVITGDGPLLAPPPYTPPPPPLPTFQPGTDPPFPPGAATAGGVFTSNTFAAAAALDVKVTLDYTTVPDVGAITGAIAVELWSDAGVLLDALAETPTNGGKGSLEASFSLEAGQDYYFKVVIPETVYCDVAKVAIGGSGFKCDCPDYTKTQKQLLNSRYNSEQVERDWTSSTAGCDVEQGCKHVMGTKLFLGVAVDVPTDIPL